LFSFPKVVEQNWIKNNIIEPKLDWDHAKELLVQHFESYNYSHRLQLLYEHCKQNTAPRETVQKYGDRFLDICSQMLVEDDNTMAINHFITGLSLPIRRELQRRIDTARSLNQNISMDSLLKVVDFAIKIDISEHGLAAVINDPSINNNNNNNNSRRGAPLCTYHPSSTTHSTEQCSRNPSNARNGSTSPQSSTFSSPQPVSQTPTVIRAPLYCWNCGQEGHTLSKCKAPRNTDRTSL
jgi:hypothetical protein